MRRAHIKFLRPGTKRKAVAETTEAAVDEYLYAPVYAAGRVLVATMLDSILFQVRKRPLAALSRSIS